MVVHFAHTSHSLVGELTRLTQGLVPKDTLQEVEIEPPISLLVALPEATAALNVILNLNT